MISKKMSGQMFIVTMLFMTGLVFSVQQILIQYNTLDLSIPGQQDNSAMLPALIHAVNHTMNSTGCPISILEDSITQRIGFLVTFTPRGCDEVDINIISTTGENSVTVYKGP